MLRRLCLPLLLPVLAACSRHPRPGDAPELTPTVCIENAAAAVGTINASSGQTRWHVLPGQTECKVVGPLTPTIVLQAVSIGGGATGPARFATRVPSGPGCWHWKLTDISGPGNLLACEEGEGEPRRGVRDH